MKFLLLGEEKYFPDFIKRMLKEDDELIIHEKINYCTIPKDIDIVAFGSLNGKKITDICRGIDPSVSILTFSPNPMAYAEIMGSGNVFSVSDSFSPLEIRGIIEKIRRQRQLEEGLRRRIIGHSSTIKRLRAQIALSSQSRLPIHISGETGTGKTLSSRMIHEFSGNKKKLVYINCSNLNSQIMDSDLFGHKKGAYTSSCSDREGLVGCADGTTLILDEVGDLPLDTQGKLLDTIENGTFRHMGSDEEERSSFRLITAANRTLEELVERKKLREDFYYRINNISLVLEPLRNHKEDIPDLIRSYEDKHSIEERKIHDFSPFMENLWKGNIRELNHLLDRIYTQ